MDKISKRMSELETINNNVSVLSEMLEHYSSESATQSDTDTMKVGAICFLFLLMLAVDL